MKRALIAFMVAAGLCAPAMANDFSDAQIEEIKYIIGQYFDEHPEKVNDALTKYQELQEKKRQEEAAKNVKKYNYELKRDKKTPVIGNKDGDFVIVEFFDYNCGFCKRMFPQVLDFVEKDGKARWVMKELPSLGDTSTKMAKFALAANNQGKYREVHIALMSLEDGFDDDKMAEIIKANGMNADKIKADMESPEIQKLLDDNRTLANNLGMSGVPMFVIEDELQFGAFDGTNELPKKAEAARAAKAEAKAKSKKAKSKAGK